MHTFDSFQVRIFLFLSMLPLVVHLYKLNLLLYFQASKRKKDTWYFSTKCDSQRTLHYTLFN